MGKASNYASTNKNNVEIVKTILTFADEIDGILDIICRGCKYWGYNNGKPMNDVGESRCLRLKRKTHACQYCRDFSAVKGKKCSK